MTQPYIINFVMNLSNKTANNQLNWQQVLFLEPSLNKLFDTFDTLQSFVCHLDAGDIYLINGKLKSSSTAFKNYLFLDDKNVVQQIFIDDCYIYQLLNAIQASSNTTNELINKFNNAINNQ